ncbi:unnamed protein product [Pylaiella littoralis]
MRACTALAAFLVAALKVAAHPICFIDDRPPDVERQLTFCPAAQDGACCTELEEAEVEARYNIIGVTLSGDCAGLYKEVQCGQCHSYSGHLFELLGADLGPSDGMIMKNDFCNDLVSKCAGQIIFPDYPDGETYCEKHTGGSDDNDNFWSYPYTEPEIFEPGLNEVFDLSDSEYPDQFLSMKMTPDGSQWWLLGQSGEIKSVNVNSLGSSTNIVDISDLGILHVAYEEGLLDFAFSPLFGQNDYFYVSYTCDLNDGENPRNRLSRFTYISGSQAGTLATQDILLTSKPKFNSIHSAGWVGFKPSDYGKSSSGHDIYWTTGDGGPQTDYTNQAQDNSNLLGSMMRITVPSGSGTSGYTIPSGNLGGGKGEICASGFRNPWRCSFDKLSDLLVCGDVGHTKVEEIDIIECGKNYGWSQFEGSRCQEAVEDDPGFSTCQGISRSGFTFPWFEYCHPDYDSDAGEQAEFTGGVDICGGRQLTGSAVICGFFYHGEYFADLLTGALIFGDVVNKNVYYLKEEEGEMVFGTIISDGSVQIVGFAEDNNGELMLITQNHEVYHMPCGDLCATTCLEQAEEQPTVSSQGCYGDSPSNRALPNAGDVCGEGEKLMSPAICAAHCAVKFPGSVYAGVEYGFECFCGGASADFDTNGKLDDMSCDYLCTANPEEFCGGFNAIEVFKLGAEEVDDGSENPLIPVDTSVPTVDTSVPTDGDSVFTFLGCFADPEGSRSMVFEVASASMTPSLCAVLCSGSPFFGTQYAQECWCGGSGAQAMFTANGPGSCTDSCTGDSSETCGGSYAISAYSTDGDAVVVDPTPVDPTPVVDDYEYAGCYADPGGSRAMTQELVSNTMTPAVCATACLGSPFFGTQFAVECWCGDDSSAAILAANGPGTCGDNCAGDSSEKCGDSYVMSVYSRGDEIPDTVVPVTPVDDDYEYAGCYADPTDSRSMTKNSDSDSMTAELCASLCPGAPFFGTQYAQECWCGSDSSAQILSSNGVGVCNDNCTGDSSEKCGDSNVMSVYSRGDEIPDTVVPVTPVDDDYEYAGCYADPTDSRSMTKNSDSDSMTAELCASLCPGAPFFGTQYAQECWCGSDSSAQILSSNGVGVCNDNCTGDSSEKCGDSNVMSVYSRGDTIPAPVIETFEYAGCYADPADNRAMEKGGDSDEMTASLCSGLCGGSPFFGTQFAKECWCGDDSSAQILSDNGEGTCNDNCTGDSSEKCGDSNVMSVYSRGDPIPETEDPTPTTPVPEPDDDDSYTSAGSAPGFALAHPSSALSSGRSAGVGGTMQKLSSKPTVPALARTGAPATPLRYAVDGMRCRCTRSKPTRVVTRMEAVYKYGCIVVPVDGLLWPAPKCRRWKVVGREATASTCVRECDGSWLACRPLFPYRRRREACFTFSAYSPTVLRFFVVYSLVYDLNIITRFVPLVVVIRALGFAVTFLQGRIEGHAGRSNRTQV